MNTKTLKSKKMRQLGFTDYNPNRWYMTVRILDSTSFNLTIEKETGEYSVEIIDEHFMQPEPHMLMKEPYKNYIRAAIDLKIYELNQSGLDINYKHPGG